MFATSYCRKCDEKNSAVFFAPVCIENFDARTGKSSRETIGTHICYNCAVERRWVNPGTGNLLDGVTL